MGVMLRSLNPRMCARRSGQAGYSFIELIITVGMILVVATLAMPSFLNYYRSARVRAGAQTLSAYLNQGRQLAIKSNRPVCVTHTTSTLQFRSTNCGGAAISVAGLTSSSSSIRMPENISLTSTASPIFGQFGNATTGATYTVADPTGRTLTVTVTPSGRITIP